MSVDDKKGKTTTIEIFKAVSTFISSIIIALTGIYVTHKYNSRQLEISKNQVDSQIVISRNKELSVLIPNLGSPDVNVRKFSAISLALYGEHVIPVLVAVMGDENQDVRMAAVKALMIIGDAVTPELERTYLDYRNNRNLRATALYALGKIRAPSAYELAASALENTNEDPIIRKDAASALAFMKEKRAIEKLLFVLRKSKDTDPILTSNIVFALGEMKDVAIAEEIISLLNHFDEGVRFQAVWALGKIGDADVLSLLIQVEKNDKSEKVKEAAKNAQAWIKRRL